MTGAPANSDEGLSAELRNQVRDMLGPRGFREGDALASLDPGVERRNLDAGAAALPASTSDLSRLMAFCNANRIAVVPLGGRTGLAGAGISRPGQLVVLTNRLNRIVGIDAAAATATVGAGVVLSALTTAAASFGLSPGIDLGARDSCTVGGLIGTNAGGMEAHRHGTMRQRVLGLEVVMPDGTVMSDLKAVLKNNEGYDLKQLFIGAEGTLGVVTQAVLKLEPDPGERAIAYCHMTDAGAAVALLAGLRRLASGVILTRAEIMWREDVDLTAKANQLDHLRPPEGAGVTVIFETASRVPDAAQSALETALTAAMESSGDGAGLVDVLLPKNAKETRDIWHVREDWAVGRVYPDGLHYDISVPPPRIQHYMRALHQSLRGYDPALNLFTLGHLADGNLHVTVNSSGPIPEKAEAVDAMVYAGLREIGGSISAEHGIGLNKRRALDLYGDPVKLATMRAVKRALDPMGLMNPGKVLA